MATKSYQDTPSYVLKRDYAASARLNLQHAQHKQCLSYLLHPSIPSLKEGMRIADVATGTGIWLLDLATEAPEHCTFEGWDISDAQFPHESCLPGNVTFGTFDVTAGVPEGLVGRYDVVHVGLLALVVKDGDPGVWIENLVTMLSKCSLSIHRGIWNSFFFKSQVDTCSGWRATCLATCLESEPPDLIQQNIPTCTL
jgi:hypothetical protein